MELVETCSKRKAASSAKTLTCSCNAKCTKRYVQPPRVKSFAPERLYKVPSKRLETSTTYHLSYLGVDRAYARSKPIRPIHSIVKSDGQFFDDTTTKLSYKPVWQIIKPKLILPKRRLKTGEGMIETMTTIRQDYGAKYGEKPDMIIPCGSIKTSSAPLEDRTMTRLSYIYPKSMEPIASFKPVMKYRLPSQPFSKETTQKLSYQPFAVEVKEFYPWTQKLPYKQPNTAMYGKTTYSESYLKNDMIHVVKPILPVMADVLPYGAQFANKTIYKESYLPSEARRIEPIIPPDSISIPDVKIAADTTSKLSYQQVWTEKRKPFLPRFTKHMLGTGVMQTETTTRSEYVMKAGSRPDPTIPCSNIRTVDVPLESETTTGLSYIQPGVMEPILSYKPVKEYHKPAIKIDSETVNKLSYQTWTPWPKEKHPWAMKRKYQSPTNPMANETIYHMSFSAPGHYIEDASCATNCFYSSNNVLHTS